ncbi:hypothetical protein Pcinc_034933, partial [Petrolisthes cinctipes]
STLNTNTITTPTPYHHHNHSHHHTHITTTISSLCPSAKPTKKNNSTLNTNTNTITTPIPYHHHHHHIFSLTVVPSVYRSALIRPKFPPLRPALVPQMEL